MRSFNRLPREGEGSSGHGRIWTFDGRCIEHTVVIQKGANTHQVSKPNAMKLVQIQRQLVGITDVSPNEMPLHPFLAEMVRRGHERFLVEVRAY